jgi:hypothetical protein
VGFIITFVGTTLLTGDIVMVGVIVADIIVVGVIVADIIVVGVIVANIIVVIVGVVKSKPSLFFIIKYFITFNGKFLFKFKYKFMI